MESVELIGVLLSVWATVFGLGGAWYTAQARESQRHFGFLLWLINSPGMILSLVGIAMGWWSGLGAWVLVPLNVIYLYTAYVGYKTTKVISSWKPVEQVHITRLYHKR